MPCSSRTTVTEASSPASSSSPSVCGNGCRATATTMSSETMSAPTRPTETYAVTRIGFGSNRKMATQLRSSMASGWVMALSLCRTIGSRPS